MKKIKTLLIIIITFFSFTTYTYAAQKYEVTLYKCVDGDTAWFDINGEKIKTRFLAINTPESTNKIEAYGKEASEFTCKELTQAKKIEIEYDDNATKTDKYNIDLVWVYVDGNLLQEKLIESGLAEVKYIYGKYKYVDDLKSLEKTAKENKIGIWSNSSENIETSKYIIILLFIFVICLFSASSRNKVKRKVKNKIKKELKKYYKNL